MSDILSIGAGAAQLYRQSLTTVSNNIANLNTEGYSRQLSSSVEDMPSQQGTLFIGTGARLEGIVRAYDEFIENSLRNSSSDLSSQQPVIKYANRIVDLMGSQNAGLSSALDKFFAAASNLSTDPASIVARNVFIRDADGLAARFRELSNQLDNIDSEVRAGIEQQINTINTLSAQLATINRQLDKKISVDQQPLQLLDQRDKVLRDLANITKISVSEETSGMVTVRLGERSGSVIVNNTQAIDLGVDFDPLDPAGVGIILDPYREAYAASNVSGGILGGLISFRTQTLGSVINSFDHLAQTFVQQINQIHTAGIDGRGDPGKALFQIEPLIEVNSLTLNDQVNIEMEITDLDNFEFSPFTLRWMADPQQWEIEQSKTGAVTRVQPEQGSFTHGGITFRIHGSLKDGDKFDLQPQSRAAAGVTLGVTDPLAIAAAKRLRVTADTANLSDARVSLDIGQVTESGFEYGQRIDQLANNSSPEAAVRVDANNVRPALIIPKGTENTTLMMEVPEDSNLRLQVMTAESVHILGHSIDGDTQQALRSEDQGFVATGAYTDTYLNQQGANAYRDLDMTYGFVARSSQQQNWVPSADGNGMQQQVTTSNALAQTQPVRYVDNYTDTVVEIVAADSLVLNGHSLPSLALAAGQQSSAAGVAQWLNSASAATGVTATAINEIHAAADDIDLLQQLQINGTVISGVAADVVALSDAINAVSATTHVTSYISRDGGLVLTNAEGHQGETMVLGNPDTGATTNALGKANRAYTGSLQLESPDIIRFTFGANGQPAGLGVMGLRTGIYIDGTVDTDMAVFVTGSGTADIAAGFTLPPPAIEAVDKAPFSVAFTSQSQYTITDLATDTVVVNRSYTAGESISYGNLRLTFDSQPDSGDSFIVDGNQQGLGDNGNMLSIVAMQDQPLLVGDRSIGDGYIDIVSYAGNKATLAKISQEALQVVYDQAVESRDKVSGVSLDQEAADLIRFQQAYQASAQIIQMSAKIFDSILAIR